MQIVLKRPPAVIAVNALLACAYFAAGEVALRLGYIAHSVGAIWPATGIALAAVLIFGYRVLPGVALGAAGLAYAHFSGMLTLVACVFASVLEPAIGSYLLRRACPRARYFEDIPAVLGFLGMAVIAAPMLPALVGALGLVAGEHIRASELTRRAIDWWAGGSLGILIVTPLLLTWTDYFRMPGRYRRVTGALPALIALTLVAAFSFNADLAGFDPQLPFYYMIAPFIVWIAVECELRHVTAANFVVAAAAVIGTARGTGPIVAGDQILTTVLLHGFAVAGSVTMQCLAVSVAQRERSERATAVALERFRALTSLSADWYWEQDSDLRFTLMEGGVHNLFGNKYGDLIGRFRWDGDVLNMRSEDWEKHREQLAKRLPFRDLVLERRAANGQVNTAIINGEPVFGTGGEFLGYRGVGRDATAQLDAERQTRESETRYRNLVNDSPDGIFLVQERTIRFVNLMTCRMLGAQPADLVGRNVFELIHPDDVAASRARLEQIDAGATTLPVKRFRFLRLDGSIVHVDALATRCEYEGKPAFQSAIRDVSEQMASAQALRESEQRFRDLNELSSDWFWEQDREFRYVSLSTGAENISRLNNESIIGKRRWELPVNGVSELEWQRHREALQAHEVFRDFQYQIVNGNGQHRWLSASGKPVFTPEGVFTGYRGSGRDITDKKHAEQALRESEARFRQIFMETSDFVALIEVRPDRRFEFQAYNPQLEAFARQKSADVRGKTPHELMPERHADKLVARYRQCVEAGTPIAFEEAVYNLEGTHHWSALLVPIRNEQGEIQLIASTARDISESKQADSEIRKLSAEQQTLLEASMVGIAFVVERRIVRCNREFARMFGYEPGELVGCSSEILHPTRALYESRGQFANQALLVDRVFSIEEPMRRKDGSLFWCQSSLRVVDPADASKGRVWVGFDTSERRAAEDQIRKLNAELEKRVRERTADLQAANRELESFSYSVSHDLRAPLRGIEGFSRLLHDNYSETLDPRGRDYLQRVSRASQRMAELIDAMLSLSRITRVELQPVPVDLTLLAREIAAEVLETQPERAVRWVIGQTEPVFADRTLMRVVMGNLLRNAWKFTSKMRSASIEFGSRSERGVTWYFVRDDGAGFDMAYAGKLFGTFQRLHGVTEYEGTGIGLATVKRIVMRHQGEIRCDARVGHGATFEFRLGEVQAGVQD